MTLLPPPGRRVPHRNNFTGDGRQRPGWRQRREEAGGAQLDPGHSHDDGPRWSWQKEESWRRNGRQLQGVDQWRQSRWRRSLRQRWRADEPGWCGGSGWPRRSRWRRRPRRRRASKWPQWSRGDRGLRRSRRNGETSRPDKTKLNRLGLINTG